jgi:hypothetical protein
VNPHAAWVAMNSPTYPTDTQLKQLRKAAKVTQAPVAVAQFGNMCTLAIKNVKLYSVFVISLE